MKGIIGLGIWFLSIPVIFANGLTISNLSRDSLAQTVTFDIEWNNSWRLDPATTPANWDAAWVFVKFVECDASFGSQWSHGLLSNTLTDHSFGSLEPIQSNGAATGLDSDLRGVMLRRSTNGLFPAAGPSTVSLHITNMAPNTAYNLRVVGIEMVFVPQGGYELGSVTYSNAFASSTLSTNTIPYAVTSENAQTVTSHMTGVNGTVNLPANFPKGFESYHMMKYEISQGQYATFMNTIPTNSQLSRYPGSYNTNRQSLNGNGNSPLSPYGADRPDRAQNYLGWEDLAAYLDWAALRPMTEMEYEKACRGTDPSFIDELAWGDDVAFSLTQITGPEDGNEIPGVLPANIHYSNVILTGGDGGRGPVRAGIFALPTNTTRSQSGAGYFGAMELSGNVWEICVKVGPETDASGAVPFDRNSGDGMLDANGNANEAGWPTLTSGGYIIRGGGYNSSASQIRISDRSQYNWDGDREISSGGRGVRG